MIPILFLAFALLLTGCSLMVILNKNPITSALWLVLGFVSLAALYLLLHAEFVAMVQVLVYAGAIMVLFLFVIMYLNLKRDEEDGLTHALRRWTGWIVGGLLLVEGLVLARSHWAPGPASLEPANGVWGNTAAIGRVLYSRYLFPFEITSILLLVAMVGAILIARGAAPRGDGAGE
ncbi:MAG: NADH-quinone oxidoreductase subunit J [Candidatus Eisenbacteria bacterium]|uniref:NADH-quinone oxidoreductase subunit J n=1 Tax=Eiseniibacteriota bacterium TaxID=2212470 RepID=A0A849STN0_UNCEI|nr:NADH-quinone oxidoreductase subunit J [Candidatus Eisenbacteria bacterium]